MLDKAVELATKAHSGQRRKHFPVPYIVHPLEVMKMLAKWGIVDQEAFIVAVLHDTIEDTYVTQLTIANNFSPGIALAVNELTFNKDKYKDKAEYLQSFKSKSILSLVVKVADRLANVMDYMLHNREYAAKYLNKAQVLFDTLKNRQREVEEEYTSEVYHRIMFTYLLICDDLGVK
jgi:(p)ppGpp synthase/HD superfamily hydrolase